jgi:hypothetical protein
VKVEGFPIERKEGFIHPKLDTSLDATVKDTGLRQDGGQLKLPVVPTIESTNVKNDNMLPNESRDKPLPQEFITNRTTLSFAQDKDLNVTVVKIKNEKGDIIRQIPEEARLKIAKFIKETYQEPRIPILNASA